MQPLCSVDHETRQNSSRRDEEGATLNEDTPLLNRFPHFEVDGFRRCNPVTVVIVLGLASMLMLGVVIGIDLLVILYNSENALPPVETPFQLVSRFQWDPNADSGSLTMAPLQTNQVIVVQTDTDVCDSTVACSHLLQMMQKSLTNFTQLPYNFLVSTNGQTFEALGWRQPSPMFPQYTNAMVLGFIGNYVDIGPSQLQMKEAENFFAESISQRHLTAHFDIIGKNTTYMPEMLFDALKALPQWNKELSDA